MFTFSLNKDEQAKLNEWMKTRPRRNEGCIGGRYIYQFCPTALGVVTKVIDDITKEEIDLTNYGEW
jgi:hypothetical protein